MMKYRCLVLFGAVATVVAVASVPMAGQAPRATGSTAVPRTSWSHPRTAWGDPDLQGVWRGEGSLPFERPEEFAGRGLLTDAEVAQRQKGAETRLAARLEGKATNRGYRAQENYNAIFNTEDEKPRIIRRTSAIIDPPSGRLPPWTLEQVKRWQAREAATRGRSELDSADDINTGARCIGELGAGRVGAWGLGYGGENPNYGGRDATGNVAIVNADGADPNASAGGPRRILQTPGYVTIFQQQEGQYQIIPLDQRPAPGPKIRQWTGVARGHWDGNTLVVEYTNIHHPYPIIPSFTPDLYPGTGETLKVTERYTRVGPDSIEYRYSVEDPAVYTRPYTVLHGLFRDDNYKMTPDLCHENNRDLPGMFANARADEQLSLENGILSVDQRQPRVDKLKKEAQEAATNKQSSTRP